MVIRALAALALVLGLIALLAFGLRRLPGGLQPGVRTDGGCEALRVLETRRLGLRHQLVRIAYGESEHLLLLGPAGDTVVASRPAAAAAARAEGEAT